MVDVGYVAHVGVAQEDSIDHPLLFGSAHVFQIVCPVDPFQLGEEPREQEVPDAVTLPRLMELGEIFSALAEAHAEVQENSCVLVLEEDLVSPYLIYSTVEREGRHQHKLLESVDTVQSIKS